MQHVLTLDDLQTSEIEHILALAEDLKRDWQQGKREPRLSSQVIGLLFSKPSLRTRVSFEAGMAQLGGNSLYLGQDVGWGTRESIADFARVISQYLDAIVCRTHAHADIVELARHSNCTVINGLTDTAHPCQALADILTLREHGSQNRAPKLAFVGDGNNVSRSLAVACARLGIDFTLAAPRVYFLEEPFVDALRNDATASLLQTEDPMEAVADATAVYTDVWSSMGFEAESSRREKDFAPYQVNSQLMKSVADDTIFLHCLPAQRGKEVTDQVIDGPQSRVVEQAANRMHAQKGLLVWLLGGAEG